MSTTSVGNPAFCRCCTQPEQQPQLGSLWTLTSGSAAASAAEGSTHAAVASKGVDYKVSPAAKAALTVFVGDVGKLSPIAYQIQGYQYNRALFNPTVTRLGQAIAGEMSLDDALKRISADIQEQLKAAGK